MSKVLVNGNAVVSITDAAGTVRVMTTFVDTMSNVGKQIDTIDVTSWGDTAETFIAGIELSPEITWAGNYEQTGTLGPDPVLVDLIGTVGTLVFSPVGTSGGDRNYTFQVIGKSFQVNDAIKEAVTYDFVMQKTGVVTVGTT